MKILLTILVIMLAGILILKLRGRYYESQKNKLLQERDELLKAKKEER